MIKFYTMQSFSLTIQYFCNGDLKGAAVIDNFMIEKAMLLLEEEYRARTSAQFCIEYKTFAKATTSAQFYTDTRPLPNKIILNSCPKNCSLTTVDKL